MKKTREYGFDNLRGLLIVLVVLGHLLEICGSFPGAGFLYRTIYSFHMPAFLFLSGYFARFDRRKIVFGLFLPYVVFQTGYILFDRLTLGENTPLQFTTPYWILWYLMADILYHLLIPMYDTTDRKRQCLGLAVTFALSLMTGYDSTVGYRLTLSRFLVFQPWFLLGFYSRRSGWIGAMSSRMESRKHGKMLLTGAVCFLSAVMHSISLRSEILYGAHPYGTLAYGPLERSIAGLAALVWIGFGCTVLLPLLLRQLPLLTALGQNTLPVYLLHGFAVRYLQRCCPGWLENPVWVLPAVVLILAAFGNPVVGGLFRHCFSGNYLCQLGKFPVFPRNRRQEKHACGILELSKES